MKFLSQGSTAPFQLPKKKKKKRERKKERQKHKQKTNKQTGKQNKQKKTHRPYLTNLDRKVGREGTKLCIF